LPGDCAWRSLLSLRDPAARNGTAGPPNSIVAGEQLSYSNANRQCSTQSGNVPSLPVSSPDVTIRFANIFERKIRRIPFERLIFEMRRDAPQENALGERPGVAEWCRRLAVAPHRFHELM